MHLRIHSYTHTRTNSHRCRFSFLDFLLKLWRHTQHVLCAVSMGVVRLSESEDDDDIHLCCATKLHIAPFAYRYMYYMCSAFRYIVSLCMYVMYMHLQLFNIGLLPSIVYALDHRRYLFTYRRHAYCCFDDIDIERDAKLIFLNRTLLALCASRTCIVCDCEYTYMYHICTLYTLHTREKYRKNRPRKFLCSILKDLSTDIACNSLLRATCAYICV